MNHLLVIGNGFDLSLGLQTGYSDFIKSKHFKELVDQENKLAKYLSDKHQEANWVDIENELAPFSVSNEVGDTYQSELTNLKMELRNYLIEIVNNSKIDTSSPAYKLLAELVDKTKIIDFNYTKVIPNIFENTHFDFGPSSYLNIHGNIFDNNIILGTQERPVKMDPNASFIKKTFADNYYDDKSLEEHFEEASHIHFFGHSLGVTDHDYFLPWFRKQVNTTPETYGKNTKVSIYYHSPESKARMSTQLNTFTENRHNELRQLIEFKWVSTTDKEVFDKHLKEINGLY